MVAGPRLGFPGSGYASLDIAALATPVGSHSGF